MPRSTASATMLLANDGLFSMTTMPANPIIESSSPVLPNFLLGIGLALLLAGCACARGSNILAEVTKPAAVPIFKNSLLSMAPSFQQSVEDRRASVGEILGIVPV